MIWVVGVSVGCGVVWGLIVGGCVGAWGLVGGCWLRVLLLSGVWFLAGRHFQLFFDGKNFY